MSKIRINELARQLEVPSHEVLELLPELGVTDKKTHSSSIDEHVAELVRRHYHGDGGKPVYYGNGARTGDSPHSQAEGQLDESPAVEVVPEAAAAASMTPYAGESEIAGSPAAEARPAEPSAPRFRRSAAHASSSDPAALSRATGRLHRSAAARCRAGRSPDFRSRNRYAASQPHSDTDSNSSPRRCHSGQAGPAGRAPRPDSFRPPAAFAASSCAASDASARRCQFSVGGGFSVRFRSAPGPGFYGFAGRPSWSADSARASSGAPAALAAPASAPAAHAVASAARNQRLQSYPFSERTFARPGSPRSGRSAGCQAGGAAESGDGGPPAAVARDTRPRAGARRSPARPACPPSR